MIFFLTALNRQGEMRTFWLSTEIEAGFTFLDNAVRRGDTLISVAIMEGSQKSQLPIDIFDGQAWRPELDALKNEWKQILSHPAPINALYKRRLSTLKNKRAQRHQVCIARLEQLVTEAQHRLDRVRDGVHSEPCRSRMLHQLEKTLKRHQQNLTTERAGLSKLIGQPTH